MVQYLMPCLNVQCVLYASWYLKLEEDWQCQLVACFYEINGQRAS